MRSRGSGSTRNGCSRATPACCGSRSPRMAGAGRRRCASASATIARRPVDWRSEEHTSELQSLMRISYAVFCLKKKKKNQKNGIKKEVVDEQTRIHKPIIVIRTQTAK